MKIDLNKIEDTLQNLKGKEERGFQPEAVLNCFKGLKTGNCDYCETCRSYTVTCKSYLRHFEK